MAIKLRAEKSTSCILKAAAWCFDEERERYNLPENEAVAPLRSETLLRINANTVVLAVTPRRSALRPLPLGARKAIETVYSTQQEIYVFRYPRIEEKRTLATDLELVPARVFRLRGDERIAAADDIIDRSVSYDVFRFPDQRTVFRAAQSVLTASRASHVDVARIENSEISSRPAPRRGTTSSNSTSATAICRWR